MQPDLDDLQSTGVRDISHWLIYLLFFVSYCMYTVILSSENKLNKNDLWLSL